MHIRPHSFHIPAFASPAWRKATVARRSAFEDVPEHRGHAAEEEAGHEADGPAAEGFKAGDALVMSGNGRFH